MRRQYQRALAGLRAPPGAGADGPPFMIITIPPPPPPSMIGPPAAGPPAPPLAFFGGTLKLMLAPTLSVFALDRASPVTSTTLTKRGSGRTPLTGAFRLVPRIRLTPVVCAYVAFALSIREIVRWTP